MKRKYTILILKPDALDRGIVGDVKKHLSRYYEIVAEAPLVLANEDVLDLKKKEWETTWDHFPSDEIIKLTYAYETGHVLVLLCRVLQEVDAIEFGRRVKGNHHLAHECEPGTVRGTFFDPIAAANTRIYYGKVSVLFDGDRPVSMPPNIIHSVDTDEEFADLLCKAFGASYNVDQD